jgi:hypothetical protein
MSNFLGSDQKPPREHPFYLAGNLNLQGIYFLESSITLPRKMAVLFWHSSKS